MKKFEKPFVKVVVLEGCDLVTGSQDCPPGGEDPKVSLDNTRDGGKIMTSPWQ